MEDKAFSAIKKNNILTLIFGNNWTQKVNTVSHDYVLKFIATNYPFEKLEVKINNPQWDSYLVSLIYDIKLNCQQQNITFDSSSLTEGLQRLINMLPEQRKEIELKEVEITNPIEKIGDKIYHFFDELSGTISFFGDTIISAISSFKNKNTFRSKDFWLIMQSTSSKALSIVTLISFLIGLILGYVGAIQLKQFGAGIYLANLVGIGMMREMGAIMTSIIMAGRTGAAFAAELGTMKLNKEIAALNVLGISSYSFLVLPRIICLSLSIPMLTIYADVVGIIAGGLVGMWVLNVSWMQYYNQLINSVTLTDFYVGLIKSVFFGIAISLVSCVKGIHCEERAEAVGKATTMAVVNSIIMIIVIDAIFTVIFNILDM